MFVLRMALRETRASWRRLLFFFICIAVGVAAIVTLRSVIQNVRAVFGREARSLMAADVVVATSRDWTPEIRQLIDRRLQEAGALARTEVVEMPTMVRPADQQKRVVRLVELGAVQAGFPLYGTLDLRGGQAYTHALLEDQGALVGPELLTALDVAVGDSIMVGQAPFTIRGVITKEPGGNLGPRLGPRVLIDFADVAATGLLSFGSRAGREVMVRVPEGRDGTLVDALKKDLENEFVNVRSFRARDDAVGEDFDRAENYLSLVGLVIVILGGIAVASVTRVFVQQKMRSIAVLKCLGSTSGQIIGIYVLQVMTLGLVGSVFGVVLARLAIAAIPLFVGDSQSLLADVEYGVTISAGAQGVGIGVLVSLLFSVVPLLQVRLVKPSLLLRSESVRGGRIDWVRAAAFVIVGAALVVLTAWQASSLKVGAIVCAGFLGVAIVLQVMGQALIRAIRPLAATRSFPLRHAVLHLSRPGNQTRVVLLAVGLGAFFIVGIRSLQDSLMDRFSLSTATDSPDMFLVDIQSAQVDGVRAFLSDPAQQVPSFRLIPTLRARITAVRGKEVNLESLQEVRGRGALAREYTVTYRDQLEANERVVDGQFWKGPSAEPEVSVEEGIRERFGIQVGDTVRFDVLGRTLDARVTSVRAVDWQDTRGGGFMFVFRPGVLDQAPHSFISPLRGPDDAEQRVRFQHDLVERYPNVSAIDFREVLKTVRDVMSKVTLAITVVGGLVLFSGGLILVGAVAMTKFQRVYEAAVFKTLGATTRTIALMLLVEYGVLGVLAGTIGSIGAVGLTWGVSRYALDIPWKPFLGEHAASVALTGVLVSAIGVLSSLDVLRHKPLATLRAE
jgi:putative ABC transport system permease protein